MNVPKFSIPKTSNADAIKSVIEQKVDVENLEIKGTDKDPEMDNVIRKYGLQRDSVVKHYDFIPFRGKNYLYITAEGVSFLCRSQVKSATIPNEGIKIDHSNGFPRYVYVISRVETVDGKTFDNVGCCLVDGNFPVALKKAVTNAHMRALRSAIGINIPDEVSVEEINGSKERG